MGPPTPGPHEPRRRPHPAPLRHRDLTRGPGRVRELGGGLLHARPLPLSGAGWGRSAQLRGHRRQDALTVSITAWCPLLLSLVALCTGDWMRGQGKGLGRLTGLPALVSGPPSHHLCLSPSRILGPGCPDPAALRVRVPGPEGQHHLLWKQQQHWDIGCELVPTAPRISP